MSFKVAACIIDIHTHTHTNNNKISFVYCFGRRHSDYYTWQGIGDKINFQTRFFAIKCGTHRSGGQSAFGNSNSGNHRLATIIGCRY